MLNGRAAWLHAPVVLFDLLVRADARAATVRSHRYYAAALELAHMAAAIDLVPSPSEIEAIDTLAHGDARGDGRGRRAPARPGAGGAPCAAAGRRPAAPGRADRQP